MEAHKLSTIFMVLFIFSICVKNSMARGTVNPAEESAAEDPDVLNKVQECVVKKCKVKEDPPSYKCGMECLKDTLKMSNAKPEDFQELEKEMSSKFRDIFCLIGCTSSGICPDPSSTDKDAQSASEESCIAGCAAICTGEIPNPKA